MSTCGKITADIVHNCLDKLVNGLADDLWLINYEDINFDSSTFDTSNKMIIDNIALKTVSPAHRAYHLEGYNFSNEHDTALVKRRFINGWDHNLLFRVFDNTPEVKKWIVEASESRFVAIIRNRYNNKNATTAGTTVFEILGWEHGLEISEVTRNAQDEESSGGWVLQAACDEVVKEPYPPYTFFVTSLSGTETAIETLAS